MKWTEKYRPETVNDLTGNREALKSLVQWIRGWEPGDDSALLYGPPGIGKTTAAHALAEDFDLIPFEINASDKRTRDAIGDELNDVAQASGFLGETRLIIVDEADNFDRGGVGAVRDGLDSATQPVILICNDYWDGISNSLKNRCEDIQFEYVNEGPITKRLMQICEAEDIEFEQDALQLIAQGSNGDVRGAVNDLQSIASGNDKIDRDTVRDRYGADRIPSSVLLVGSQDVDPKEARDILETFSEKIRGYDEVIIRGTPGFDIVAGEWAKRFNLQVTIIPPFYEEDLFDEEVWELRYEDLARSGNHFDACFYNETPDWREYAKEFNCLSGIEMGYGWLPDDTDEETQLFWDNLRVDRANLAHLY